MTLSSGVSFDILLGLTALVITLLGIIAAFFYWKGRLDEWKEGINTWRSNVTGTLDNINDNIKGLVADVAAIKASLEKDASRDGMLQKQSPLMPSEEAKRILRELSIISQVDSNILLIKNKVEDRSRSSVYHNVDDPEERFIEIAPSIIHELIEKGEIDGKKVDEAMKRLSDMFSPAIATYYGVLLLIASYVLEELRKKQLVADFSLIYKQISLISPMHPEEQLALFEQDIEKAIESFKRSIRTLSEIGDRKDLVQNKNSLAVLYSYVGQMDEAEKELKEAIELDPSFVEAYVNRGNVYASLRKFEKAIADYDKAIELDPSFVEAYVNRGNVYASLKKFEKAIADYDKAIELDPLLAQVYRNRGNAYSRLREPEKAIRDFHRALELDSQDKDRNDVS